jgi:hypothetical protein
MCPGVRLAMAMENSVLTATLRRFRVTRPGPEKLDKTPSPVFIPPPKTPAKVCLVEIN